MKQYIPNVNILATEKFIQALHESGMLHIMEPKVIPLFWNLDETDQQFDIADEHGNPKMVSEFTDEDVIAVMLIGAWAAGYKWAKRASE